MGIKLKKINIFRWEKVWEISIPAYEETTLELESASDLLSVELDSIVLFNKEKFVFEYTTPMGFSYKKVKEWVIEAIKNCVPVLPDEVREGANFIRVTTLLWQIKLNLEK